MAAISSCITKIDNRKTFQLLIRYARLKLKNYVPSQAKRMSPLFHHQDLFSDWCIHICLVHKFLSCSPRIALWSFCWSTPRVSEAPMIAWHKTGRLKLFNDMTIKPSIFSRLKESRISTTGVFCKHYSLNKDKKDNFPFTHYSTKHAQNESWLEVNSRIFFSPSPSKTQVEMRGGNLLNPAKRC